MNLATFGTGLPGFPSTLAKWILFPLLISTTWPTCYSLTLPTAGSTAQSRLRTENSSSVGSLSPSSSSETLMTSNRAVLVPSTLWGLLVSSPSWRTPGSLEEWSQKSHHICSVWWFPHVCVGYKSWEVGQLTQDRQLASCSTGQGYPAQFWHCRMTHGLRPCHPLPYG